MAIRILVSYKASFGDKIPFHCDFQSSNLQDISLWAHLKSNLVHTILKKPPNLCSHILNLIISFADNKISFPNHDKVHNSFTPTHITGHHGPSTAKPGSMRQKPSRISNRDHREYQLSSPSINYCWVKTDLQPTICGRQTVRIPQGLRQAFEGNLRADSIHL